MDDGLQNTGGGNKKFVNTFKGKFTLRSNEEDPFAIKRVNKMNATVYEKHFDTLTGYLVGIEKFISEKYDPSWNLTLLTEQGEEYLLNVPYSGRITMGVFGRFPNMDTSKKTRLRIYYFEEEDKAAIVLQQKNDEDKWADVGKYWTKEDPKHLPDLVQTVVNGKEVWDATARMRYLERYLVEIFGPKLDTDAHMIIEAFAQKPKPKEKTDELQMPDKDLYEDKNEPKDEDIVVSNTTADLPEETDDLPF